MCGHIHTAADKKLGEIHYLNSGDWVESLTAVVEHLDGDYQLLSFSEFLAAFPFPSNVVADDLVPAEEEASRLS